MFERLALSIFIGFLGWMIYLGLTRWLSRRRTPGLEGYILGRPAILYFSSDDCSPCHTVQKPALEKLSEAYGWRLQIIEFDVVARPDLAATWGVLSLPTTFIIDTLGQARGVNMGVASENRLTRQLIGIGESPHDTTAARSVEPRRTETESVRSD
jgi:thioredoxin-like negative regulator of GroEL